MTPNDNGRRLTRREAANFLTARGFRVASSTLAKYATIGGGPTYSKFGIRPTYTEGDLLAWAASKTVGPLRSSSEQQAV